jgi:hypothetical protein
MRLIMEGSAWSFAVRRKFLTKQALQMVRCAQPFRDSLQSAGNERAGEKLVAIRLAHHGLARGRAVGKFHTFIASAARPFVNIVKQMAMDRFQVRRVELSLGATAQFNFENAMTDVAAFQPWVVASSLFLRTPSGRPSMA